MGLTILGNPSCNVTWPATRVLFSYSYSLSDSVPQSLGLFLKRGLTLYSTCLFSEYATKHSKTLQRSIFMSSLSANPLQKLPLGRQQHCKLLPGVSSVQANQVALWTVDEVSGALFRHTSCLAVRSTLETGPGSCKCEKKPLLLSSFFQHSPGIPLYHISVGSGTI